MRLLPTQFHTPGHMSMTRDGHRMLMGTEKHGKGASGHQEGFRVGNIRFTAFWSTGKWGQRFIQTQTFCGRETFSQCGDWHDGRGQMKQALGWQAEAASSAGNSRPCTQRSLWVQLLPAERRLDGPWSTAATLFDWEHADRSRGAEQHRKWLRGPKGWFMKWDEYHCY